MKKTLSICALCITSVCATSVMARDQIQIVGSSTVYPFSTVVAERFGQNTKFKTPVIESTGSGGGMKLFCKGVGASTPDITNASRRIKKKEFAMCQKNGVKNITEVMIGFDGIVFANSKKATQASFTLRDIYLALAKVVPAADGSETLVPNYYKTWQDVNASLPDMKIEVLGPPPTSGTRDAFAELAIAGGCKTFPWLQALKKTDKKKYKKVCHELREDGSFIEAGENDNLIVQKLDANPQAFGVFGFSFLGQNLDKVQGSIINGKAPSSKAIAQAEYKISRPLYFYVKNAHVGSIPGIKEFVRTFVSKKAIGKKGYLVEKDLIPLAKNKRKAMAQEAKSFKPLAM